MAQTEHLTPDQIARRDDEALVAHLDDMVDRLAEMMAPLPEGSEEWQALDAVKTAHVQAANRIAAVWKRRDAVDEGDRYMTQDYEAREQPIPLPEDPDQRWHALNDGWVS